MIKRRIMMTEIMVVMLLFFSSCAGDKGSITKLKNDKLKLQEENLALREENLQLKKQLQGTKHKEDLMTLKDNLGALRNTISIFYGDHEGVWPPSLEELVPKYLLSIPDGDWNYNPETGKIISKSHPSW